MAYQQAQITSKLQAALTPLHLEVVNESHLHGRLPGSESHFRVLVVAEAFVGKSLVAQHRMVHEILRDELHHAVHALTLQTLTPLEWDKDHENRRISSPVCRGGSKQGGVTS